MSNRFFAIVLVVIAIFLGVFFFTKSKSDAPGSSSSASLTNHVEGGGKSGVTLVEYGDFECPACGAYYPVVKQVVEKYKSDITFQFRNFPLVQVHKNAFAAHRAAEAASKQDKFWEMHDKLYETQATWKDAGDPSAIFVSYAQELGLNVDQFKTDMASAEINNIIDADIKEAQRLGADSTPTFLLNGKKLDKNPASLEEFMKLIQDAITAAKG